MTPLRCEGRGGDQERLAVEEVTKTVYCCGKPLGTIEHIYNRTGILQNFYISIISHTCRSSQQGM